ncbi:MAG: hypothetical protein M3164_03595 [Actinomycetota bacterium]|nr:hypothetical protein [Actinomycetota bacterium]
MARGLTAVLGFVGWIYSWTFFRSLRADYSLGDLGSMPAWLVVLMGVASTALIAAGLSAAMRTSAWPAFAVVGGVFLFLLVVLGQQAVMRAAPGITDPSFSQAFQAAIRARSPIAAALFVIAVPSALVVFGLAGAALRGRLRGAGQRSS